MIPFLIGMWIAIHERDGLIGPSASVETGGAPMVKIVGNLRPEDDYTHPLGPEP